MKTAFIIIILLAVIGCSDEKNIKLIKISGTVERTLLVAEQSWLNDTAILKYKIFTLSNGKKYRLTPEQGKGIAKGFDVELFAEENKNKKNEYQVHSIKIISIPIGNKKIKYKNIKPEGNISE